MPISTVARYLALQLVSLAAQLIGTILLVLPCATRAWHPAPSTENRVPTTISVWNNRLLWLWGNDEDGITPLWYNPAGSRWKAYVWTALRNPVDNFKYLWWTQRALGPLWRREFHVLPFKGLFYVQAGWNASGHIVGSLGRKS